MIAEGTNAHKIMSFLVSHPDEAFRRSEVLDGSGVKEGSIGPTLNRLHERGLVQHRQKYWTVNEARLGQVASLKSTFEGINRHYEPETREDWVANE